MLFRWLRARRRRSILERPFPAAWTTILRRLVKHVEWLSEEEQERLRDWIAIFVAEKRFEGCGGQEITDEVKVAIAGQAGLVALGFADEFFAGLHSVLV
jgi:Mlc titration factor MtfA (ptsG expression regulator)